MTIEHHTVNIERLLSIRPYCEENYGVEIDAGIPASDKADSEQAQSSKAGDSQTDAEKKDLQGQATCDCSSCDAIKKKQQDYEKISQDEKVEESQFHDELLNTIFELPGNRRKKRNVQDPDPESELNSFVQIEKKSSSLTPADYRDSKMTTTVVFKDTVNGTSRQLLITNLTHFSKYTVSIKACLRGQSSCSEVTSLDFRTDKKYGADDIPGKIISNQDKTNGTNGRDVWISWPDPVDPNLAIVYYQIRVKMQHVPTNIFKACLTAREFNENGRKYSPQVHGTFYVSVRAVSLAGPGEYSEEVLVNAGERSNTLLLSILLPILGLIFTVTAIALYLFYRRQRPSGDDHIMNPIYQQVLTSNFLKSAVSLHFFYFSAKL